jgi:hypothetical protein
MGYIRAGCQHQASPQYQTALMTTTMGQAGEKGDCCSMVQSVVLLTGASFASDLETKQYSLQKGWGDIGLELLEV